MSDTVEHQLIYWQLLRKVMRPLNHEYSRLTVTYRHASARVIHHRHEDILVYKHITVTVVKHGNCLGTLSIDVITHLVYGIYVVVAGYLFLVIVFSGEDLYLNLYQNLWMQNGTAFRDLVYASL